MLSVGKPKVSGWLARTAKELKDRRDKKIFDLWTACHSMEEIAEATDCDKATVSRVCDGSLQSVLQNQMQQAAAEHVADYKSALYNIWKQQEKTQGGPSHFGNSEVRWLDHLLKRYTKPFDIVVDPFAGSGSIFAGNGSAATL